MIKKHAAENMVRTLLENYDVDQILTMLINEIVAESKNSKNKGSDHLTMLLLEKRLLVECRNKAKLLI